MPVQQREIASRVFWNYVLVLEYPKARATKRPILTPPPGASPCPQRGWPRTEGQKQVLTPPFGCGSALQCTRASTAVNCHATHGTAWSRPSAACLATDLQFSKSSRTYSVFHLDQANLATPRKGDSIRLPVNATNQEAALMPHVARSFDGGCFLTSQLHQRL